MIYRSEFELELSSVLSRQYIDVFFCVEEGKNLKNTVKYELFIGINMGTFMLNSTLLILKNNNNLLWS